MSDRKVTIKSRNEQFSRQVKSSITLEIADDNNEFLSQQMFTHGYDVLDLMDHCDPIDNLFLLFKGELPSPENKKLLTTLSTFLMNTSPRSHGARAAANAGIGRTDVNHILPIAIMGMGGAYGGSKEVENAMRFMQTSKNVPMQDVISRCLTDALNNQDSEGDFIIAPGFGTDHKGQSPFLLKVKDKFLSLCPTEGYLAWGQDFINQLSNEKSPPLQLFKDKLPEHTLCGWRLAAIVAGVLLDLGIPPRVGAGLYQHLASPGAFAHGVSFANKPITDIPFLKDEDYEIKSI